MAQCPAKALFGQTAQGKFLSRKPEVLSPIGHRLEPVSLREKDDRIVSIANFANQSSVWLFWGISSEKLGGKAHAEKQKKSAMACDSYGDNFLVGLCLPQTGGGDVLRGYLSRHRRAHRFRAARRGGQLSAL